MVAMVLLDSALLTPFYATVDVIPRLNQAKCSFAVIIRLTCGCSFPQLSQKCCSITEINSATKDNHLMFIYRNYVY